MGAIVEGAVMPAPEPRGLCVRLPGGAQMEIAAPGQVKAGGATAPRAGRGAATMLSFPGSLKAFVAREPCDLR